MGFIRGGLLTIVIIILFISLILGNAFFVASSSLDYKNVKEQLSPVIQKIVLESIDSSDINQNLQLMRTYCEQNNNMDYVIDEEDFKITITCDEIFSGTPESIINIEIEQFINQTYYKDYDCGILDCLSKEGTPFFLMSKNTKDYLRGKFYLLLLVALVLLVIMFFLLENKKNLPFIFGILIMISSLPFIWINSLSKTLSNETAREIISALLSNASSTFIIFFVFGLIIFGVGIALKFWKSETGEAISNLSKSVKSSKKKK